MLTIARTVVVLSCFIHLTKLLSRSPPIGLENVLSGGIL